MAEHMTFVGLDAHKETIAIGLAEGGRRGEVRHWGTIENRPEAVERMVGRLEKRHGELSFCYEAGPLGYGLHRQITGLGHDCQVVAPSLIPRRPGERVKTDRRDCLNLAKLHRAGELTAVWVPDAAHEAMRDLVRGRRQACEAQRRARQQAQGFLLRHGRVFSGRGAWTKAHRSWLARQRFVHPAQQIVLQEHREAIAEAEARLQRLERQIAELVPSWSLAPVVQAIQALRGIALIAAVTVMAELGDLRRFPGPRQVMAYLGLVPAEHSSGPRTRRGAITKAGNKWARLVLIEGAWSYRLPARVSAVKARQLTPLPKAVRDIAWKAQLRLCARYRRLIAKGKPANVVTTAIAREMAAFIWAIGQQLAPAAAPACG